MSFALPPSVTKTGAPAVTDDASKGFVVGSSIVDTSASPRALYFCTDTTIGAAVWQQMSNHAALINLPFASSGHTGLATSVAAFDAVGAAQTVQATTNETMLVRRAGILQWVPIAVAALSFSGLTGSTPGDLSLGTVTITTGVFA